MSQAGDYRQILPGNWRPLRLATLVGLRWLAIIGQTVGVLFVDWGLGYPLPLVECLSLIALSAVVNLALILRSEAGDRPSATVATLQLGYDLLQLGGLLYLTGGLENPFSLLLLAPVSVSATTLPQRSTFILAALAIAVASAISFLHLALPWDPERRIVFDRVYIIGVWVSIVCGVVFVSAYTNRVAHEARQLADALTATELALSRHEQLSALDGLAAAAAHELGTPLSTIALAAKEMKADIPPGPLADDVDLIIAQSARCRAILAKLRSLRSGETGDPFAAVPLGELLEEVATPLEGTGKSIFIEIPEAEGEPVFRRNAGLLYGLGNLIENATQFARLKVTIEASWDREQALVTITDDGPGFADDLITRLGEPYLTTRARNTAPDGDAPGGLGLGIFISKTLLERTGARLAFENASGGGARVRITWPRKAIES
ncbi:MAG: ActS/PrrB/RegB family redox-sensitive histidine kinase [Hyphomicrobiales bacterium]|nr:MAG: ActS/PrrB/RegB family redox-sensitive histidine kinase [Hyphomicrobiales bacterium]